MREDWFEVGYRLLDDDLVDSEGRRCGKVDDLELEGKPGGSARIGAILHGPGAFAGRLPRPLAWIVRRLFGTEIVRVPWDEVKEISAVVKLKHPAEKLGLGRGDDRARHLVSWIPGSGS